MDRPRRPQTPHTGRLDVDDSAAPQSQHVLCPVGPGDRFVEADRRAQALLQLGVPQQVIGGQRLFDHHQLIVIQLGQTIGVSQGVGAVRIDHQRRRPAQCLADGGDVFQVGAGRDLALDLAVARLMGGPRFFHQTCGIRLNPQRDAGGDLFPGAAQPLGEAHATALRRERPGPHLHRRLRHVMAAEVALQRRMDCLRAGEHSAQHPGSGPFADGMPRGVHGLGRVVRELAGCAFRPDGLSVRVGELKQEDAAGRGGARRDSEGLLEGKLDLAQRDPQDPQTFRWRAHRARSPCSSR